MGAFTFGVAAALVVFQCTLVLLQRDQSTWSFSLTNARPDASEWAPELKALGLSNEGAPNHSNTTNRSSQPLNFSALMVPDLNDTRLLLLTVQQTSSLTCLRAIVNASPDMRSGFAASCILRTHTPAEVTPVLEPFNPHLILLSLTCLQCLMAFGRMYLHRREGEDKRPSVNAGPYISIEGVAAVLTAILLASAIVQGVHAPELVRYPTLLVLVLNWLLGAWYVRDPEGQGFHSASVAAPLSVLCSMLFGPRLWPDILQHYVLLIAAIYMALLMRKANEDARPVMRAVVLLLLFVSLGDAVWNTGVFDAWRYVLIWIGSVGLLPLTISMLMPELSIEVKAHHSLGGMELMANNAALLGVLVLLANL